jgi:hypothetical protein
LMLFEFASSTELFATTTFFGAIVLGLSAVLFSYARAKVISLSADVALAYALLILILSPYLYFVVAPGLPPIANPAEAYSNDLLAFVFPTNVELLGSKLLAPITTKFTITPAEMAAYLGPGLWLMFVLFIRTYWRTKTGKLLLMVFSLIALASLGPKLHIRGVPYIPLPWLAMDKLPLIDLALPGRFGMYLFLIAAVIVAIYLSGATIPFWCKVLLGVSAVAFVAPNLALTESDLTKVDTPFFFSSGEYQRYISRDDIVLVLPYSTMSQTMLWQAQTNFFFRIATGFYLPPLEYQRWPVTASFATSSKVPDFARQLEAFLRAHQVKAVIVKAAAPGPWPRMLSEAGLRAVATGGVLFYAVQRHVLASFLQGNSSRKGQRFQ